MTWLDEESVEQLTSDFGRDELSQMGAGTAGRILSVFAVSATHEITARADPG